MKGKFKKPDGLELLALLLLTALAYGNSLSSGFVWDDKVLIVDKAAFFSHIRNAFRILVMPDGGLGDKTPYYRPLNTLSYMLDHYLWGLRPFFYHMENMLLHALAAALLYLLLGEIFKDRMAAFFAAALFALYPVNTEAVDFLANRNLLFCAVFSFASLLLLAKNKKFLSLLAYFLALLSKEPAVVLPFFLLSLRLTARNGDADFPSPGPPAKKGEKGPSHGDRPGISAHSTWKTLSWFFAATFFYFLIRHFVLGTFLSKQGISFSAGRPRLMATAVFENFRLMVNPFKLNANYSMSKLHFTALKAAIALAGVASLLFLSIARKTPFALRAGSQWILWELLPVSNIVAIPSAPVAERYLYMILPGFVLILGYAFSALYRKKSSSAMAILVLLLLAFGARTFSRNLVWRSNLSLFTSMVKSDPGNAAALNSLANYYLSKGQLNAAFRSCRRAISAEPAFDKAQITLGRVYLTENRLQDAEGRFKTAIALAPGNAYGHANLAMAYMRQNLPEMAIPEFQAAAGLRPDDPKIRFYLGKAYMALGRPDEAMREFLRSIKLDPDNAMAHMELGVILAGQDSLYAARREFQKAADLDPELADAHVNLGISYMQQGLADKALQEFQTAVKLDPSNVTAHNNLGVIYAGRNLLPESENEFRTALRLDPSNPVAKRDLSLLAAVMKKAGGPHPY